MKKISVGIIFIAFALCALAFAGDQTAKTFPKPEPAKVTSVKVVKMKTSGKVVAITDTTLKIERTVKGTVEASEFALEKPLTKIKVGDKVVITYVIKDEKNVITKVTKQGPKLRKKIVQPMEKMEPKGPSSESSVPTK